MLADPTTIEDARESLAFWERRARRLPRRALRRRREARHMAGRWRGRLAAAERDRYGRGLLGMLLLVVAERRLPAPAHDARRRVGRRARQAATVVAVAAVVLVIAAAVAAVEVASALLGALT